MLLAPQGLPPPHPLQAPADPRAALPPTVHLKALSGRGHVRSWVKLQATKASASPDRVASTGKPRLSSRVFLMPVSLQTGGHEVVARQLEPGLGALPDISLCFSLPQHNLPQKAASQP